MTTTTTVKADTFTGVSSYTTNVLSVGTYYELACDINITSSSANIITVNISRTDANSALFPLFSQDIPTGLTSLDIGPCYGYPIARAFGDGVKIDITAAGGGSSIVGTISVKGKGA